MRTKIGQASLHFTTRELAWHFEPKDTRGGHDWCGPTVAIKSIDFFLQTEVNAMVTSKDGLYANVGFSVLALITDEHGRMIEKPIGLSKFKEDVRRGSYSCGWHDGPNKIELNEIGIAMMAKVGVQTAERFYNEAI